MVQAGGHPGGLGSEMERGGEMRKKDGDEVIITAALTGALTVPSQTPHLPITPQQIAEEARLCREAGAAGRDRLMAKWVPPAAISAAPMKAHRYAATSCDWLIQRRATNRKWIRAKLARANA